MSRELAAWRQLVTADASALLEAADKCDARDVHAVARLRRHWSADHVRVALQLTEARRKAATKFPDHASILLADPAGVEQATSLIVAKHKAKRYRAAGASSVIDLCCGIGGDAMGFRFAGLDVLAVDSDPVRAWMAGCNAGCSTAGADVETIDVAEALIHIDPARRTEHGRIFKLRDTEPAPEVVARLLDRAAGGGVKLSPAVNLNELADALPPGEVEFISENGKLVQTVLWTRPLAQAERRATRIAGEAIHSQQGVPARPPSGPLDRYLYTLDPALERSGLIDAVASPHNLTMPHPQLGLLTGPDPITSPWLTPFELLAEMPWQTKKVKRWLTEHNAGIVEVKTRGKAVDPDRTQADLRGKGDQPFTVFVLRRDRKRIALITRRCV
ncbi:MAG: hypothetical protein GVY24_00860 [Planctomycetes bacterium]|jgi:SAM-dependent methyltransferase|nr:hypothetical protein [Planctomycetota bacterium]